MKLFRISIDYSYAFADIFESNNGADSLSLTSESSELLKKFRYGWITEDSTVTPDITIIMSELFCVDEKTLTELRSYLLNLTPNTIIIGKDTFYSLSNIPVLKDTLNLKTSRIKYFSTGDIMEVIKPVFNERDYPNLFKSEEVTGSFFCTEDLKNAIVDNNITGIIFEECKVKSKSWFRK